MGPWRYIPRLRQIMVFAKNSTVRKQSEHVLTLQSGPHKSYTVLF